ncbi:hypothetical protein [Rhodoblastus sp.]|uniref:hypothetical protein n=1 Tax=Rhodoblastus sp. TaxID=1962975 RepID=UPI003F9B1D45
MYDLAMADSQALTILRRKRDDIEGVIASYEKRLEEARYDLSVVNATLRLFEVNGTTGDISPYFDIKNLFRRGETIRLCRMALAKEGPLDTRELALRVVRAKKFDESDKILVRSITFRIVQVLRSAERHGRIASAGKRGSRRVWALGPQD